VDSLRKIASDTGAPLKDLARSFGRFNYALAENNVPMSRTLEMTQTITNALKMNGATTQEASSAMLQFSQALGKGYMNGDEFRNMMETMPMVARQVASSMGIAFGQLKDAASAGKVTWDVLLDAITDPAFQDEMKRKADAVQLFQYSWQSFVDKVTYSIGQFDKLTGTSSMVKSALDLMGDGAASAGEKLEALDNTFQALSISSSNAISRLSAQFPALQSAVNSFNSNGFIDELKKMADYASSPMMANVFKLLSIGLSGVTKIGDDFATRKTAMSTLMPGYSMTGETKSTDIPKFGMSKPVEMNMDMIVRDKRLAELVKAYQSYELKQSEFESKFNDIVYGKSGSGKKSRGGSTAINDAIRDAQEAQKAYENLIEKGLSPGDKILSDMVQHMGKLNETKREHVRLIAYEADELEFLKVINEEVFDQREQITAECLGVVGAGSLGDNEFWPARGSARRHGLQRGRSAFGQRSVGETGIGLEAFRHARRWQVFVGGAADDQRERAHGHGGLRDERRLDLLHDQRAIPRQRSDRRDALQHARRGQQRRTAEGLRAQDRPLGFTHHLQTDHQLTNTTRHVLTRFTRQPLRYTRSRHV
jgi:tape measure domain-containing protein